MCVSVCVCASEAEGEGPVGQVGEHVDEVAATADCEDLSGTDSSVVMVTLMGAAGGAFRDSPGAPCCWC